MVEKGVRKIDEDVAHELEDHLRTAEAWQAIVVERLSENGIPIESAADEGRRLLRGSSSG